MKDDINGCLFEMVTILEQKKGLMKTLLTLTEQQRDLFTLDSIEMLDSSLEQNQTCIDEIDRLDEKFDKLYAEMKEWSDELPEKCKISRVTETLMKRMQEDIVAIKDIISQIQKIGPENHQKAAELLQLIQENIKATSKEKKAIAVYGENQLQKAALEKDQ